MVTIIVPVVHSSRRGVNSNLAAAIGMAVAYARGDVAGDMYRDLLDSAMGHIGDVLTLVRLAVQRRGHLVPVFAVNLERLAASQRRGTAAITLRELDFRDSDRTVVGAYWEPGAPLGHEALAPDEPSLAAAFHECAIIGTLPPARG